MCRFLLELRKLNASTQSVPSLNIDTIPGSGFGIRGRLQRLNESIIQDFGNSGINYELEADDFLDGHQEASAARSPNEDIDTELGITAEEFPWAIAPAEDNINNTVGDIGGPSTMRSR